MIGQAMLPMLSVIWQWLSKVLESLLLHQNSAANMNLTTKQPHLVVTLPDSVHFLSIVQIRQLAAGACYTGDKEQMIRILAKAVKDFVDE